jgi:hypothetical protein
VHAVAGERVERRRQHRGERLALAGLHLHDPAVVHRQRGDDLDVERPQAERAPRRLACDGIYPRPRLVSGSPPQRLAHVRPCRERLIGGGAQLRSSCPISSSGWS